MFFFRYPLRPLTALGRVMLCIAMSLLATVLMLISPPTHADDSQAVKAESPYFYVDSKDPAVDRLPRKSTNVDVCFAGVAADVTITQHSRNEGERAIAASYLFPGSTQSPGYAMSLRLDDRCSLHASGGVFTQRSGERSPCVWRG
jgi:Ca-activated chloride channel family protein